LATTYTWSAAALNAQDYGNVIQNSQARSINANVDFVNLYNKVGYLRSINNFQIGQPASTSTGPSRSRQRPGNTDQSGGRDSRSEQSDGPGIAEAALLRPIMAIRTLKFNYTENLSSVVPGFTPSPKFMGMNEAWSAPGVRHILGIQPTDSRLA